MAKRPARRPTRVDTIGSTSVADPTTERALSEVRDYVLRLKTAVANSTNETFTVTEDLPFNDFSATEVHTMEMTHLGASPGLDSRIYMVGNDWFVTDGVGNEIQITDGGALAVTGTADIYGDQQRHICLKDFTVTTGTTGGSHNGYSIIEANSAPTVFLFGPLPFRVGERIKGARVRTNKNALGTMTVQFGTSNDGSGISATGSSATSSTNGLQTISLTLASPVTTTQDNLYYLQISCPNVSDRLFAMSFTADKVV